MTKSNPPSTRSPDLDTIDAELEQVARERASLLDAVAALPAKERRLLDRNAPDAEILSLDITRRRLAVQLDELDETEARLLAAIPEAERENRRTAWLGYVDRLEALAIEAAAAADRLRDIDAAVRALAREAAGAGFNRYQGNDELPDLSEFRVPFAGYAALPVAARGLRTRAGAARAPLPLHAIRLRRFVIVAEGPTARGYPAGAIAGFEAATAWRLVDAEDAEFVEARRAPPQPVKARKSHRRATA